MLLAGPLFNLLSAFVFSFVYILAVGYSVPVVTELAENPDTGMPYASELREGDVIVAVNGREITFLDTAAELMAQIEPGETAVFTVERDGVRVNADVAKSAEENGGKHGGGFIFIQAPRFLGRLSLGFFELSMREYPLFFLSLNNRMLSGGGQQVSCNFVRKK